MHDFKEAHASENIYNLNQNISMKVSTLDNSLQKPSIEHPPKLKSEGQSDGGGIEKVLNNKDLNAIAQKYETKNSSKPTIPKGNQGIVKKNKNPIILVHGFSDFSDDNKPIFIPS